MSIIKSLLDTDLYKCTQQQAVLEKFPKAIVKYKFIDRGNMKFTDEMTERLCGEIEAMRRLSLNVPEVNFLKKTCPFLYNGYIDILKGYKYDPTEVSVKTENNKLSLSIKGPWYRTILWEVPLMALVSEIYFKYNKVEPKQSDVDYAYKKIHDLYLHHKATIADFGTRRRISGYHHDVIVNNAAKLLTGTSNVYLAYMNNIKPIGTQAHEWFMFHGAMYGYKRANHKALKNWVNVYNGNLGIALTDTFTTDNFLKSFNSLYAKLFDGVRHDSGCPFEFINKIRTHYCKLGIDSSTKTIVFSDGLNSKKIIDINAVCEANRIKCSFGLGTNFSNDIEGSTPLNMVIKMTEAKFDQDSDWEYCVKLSDTKGKHTGNPDEIDLCKRILKIC
jgi:nicotinate phosphoribosyltransferase